MTITVTSPREDRLWQEIVDNALVATDSRYVHIALLESESQISRIVAWNYAPASVWRKAQNLVEDFLPGFSPSRVTVKVNPEKGFGRVYIEKKSVVGPLEELAAGIVDPRVVRVAANIGRVRHILTSPLWVEGKVIGAMVFGMPKPMSEHRQQMYEAFVRQVGLTLEHGRIAQPEQATDQSAVLEFGDLRLDPVSHQASRGQGLLHLTPTEFELLRGFMRHPGRAFSREELAREVWGKPASLESNFIDVAVAGLRKKLEAGTHPRIIQTVRGHGYVLREA